MQLQSPGFSEAVYFPVKKILFAMFIMFMYCRNDSQCTCRVRVAEELACGCLEIRLLQNETEFSSGTAGGSQNRILLIEICANQPIIKYNGIFKEKLLLLAQ